MDILTRMSIVFLWSRWDGRLISLEFIQDFHDQLTLFLAMSEIIILIAIDAVDDSLPVGVRLVGISSALEQNSEKFQVVRTGSSMEKGFPVFVRSMCLSVHIDLSRVEQKSLYIDST